MNFVREFDPSCRCRFHEKPIIQPQVILASVKKKIDSDGHFIAKQQVLASVSTEW